MRVAFLVTNPHLDLDAFQRISEALGQRHAEGRLYAYDTRLIDRYPAFRIARVPVYGGRAPDSRAAVKALQFVAFVLDRAVIRRFLRRQRLDVLVMGGDITDHYGRLFLDACRSLRIRVLLVPVAMPAPPRVNPDPDKGVRGARAVRLMLRLLGMEQTVFFRSWVLGSYHTEAMIAAPTHEVARLLSEQGIDPARVAVTGNPSWDVLADIVREPAEEIRSATLGVLGLGAASKVVVFISEVIHEVYGIEFLRDLLPRVAAAFDGLPEEDRVVIRLHPRESKETTALYRECFSGARYVVESGVDLLRLLKAADVAIAFYSKALVDAALLGTSVLSLRFDDDGAPVRFGGVNDATHVTRVDELAPKIRAVVHDPAFRRRQADVIGAWRRAEGVVLDGRCCERTAELILRRTA